MPRPAIHPGEILADELAELGVTPTELSRQINVPPNRVTQIIHGRRLRPLARLALALLVNVLWIGGSAYGVVKLV